MSLVQLEGRVLSCGNCRTHIAISDDVISKAFHGRSGRSLLVNTVVNVDLGQKESRHLMTGLHTVCNANCLNCHETLGWKYEAAQNLSQQYKVGKFIVENAKLFQEYS